MTTNQPSGSLTLIETAAGEHILINEKGQEVIELVALSPEKQAVQIALETLKAALKADTGAITLPRVAIAYEEGLLGAIHADIPCEVILIEDDQLDEPPTNIRKRQVLRGDRESVEAAVALAERRRAKRGATW